MTWSSVDWTATEAVVGRIQDRIFRAAKIKRPRLEPDDEQSSCPVLRGLGSGNGARLPARPQRPRVHGHLGLLAHPLIFHLGSRTGQDHTADQVAFDYRVTSISSVGLIHGTQASRERPRSFR